ncbi:MAG: GNAT family N-acetyltransferase [Anaerolineales bacterium]|nr:GNAT family N-acetyltransferase [Anaerolineales bacterium]
MKLIARKYQHEDDYWRIRQFLREVFLLNQCRELSWPVYRWDYWRWHVNENIFRFDLSAAVFLWETAAGRLAAVLNPDGAGEAFLQIHPDFHSPELEVEMMSTAETQFATRQAGGQQRLMIWAPAADLARQDRLKRRGYRPGGAPEYQRHRGLDLPIPVFPTPAGYTLRAVGEEAEHPARSWVSWRAFHPDEPEAAYGGWEWYRNVQRAPLYRRDLDLVAVAPDGEHAAFCTLWFDDVTRTAAFEPVGVHPAHQRRGLGKALMAEGLRRVRGLGATLCTVGSYSEAAGALYAALGFTHYELSEPWIKEW